MSKTMHLRTRIYVSCSILLVVTLVISCVWISILMLNIYEKEALSTSRRDLSLVTNALETTLSHLSNYAISLSSDSRVIAAAKKYPDAPKGEALRSNLRVSLGKNITSIIGSISDFYMWDMYSLNGNSFGVSGMDMSRVKPVLDQAFFERARSQLSYQLHGPYTLMGANYTIPVFLMTKTIVDLDTRQACGLLLFVIRESRISSIFTENVPSSDVSFLVLGQGGTVISSKNISAVGQPLSSQFSLGEADLSELQKSGQLTRNIDGTNTLFVLSPVDDKHVDWHILMTTSLNNTRRVWQGTLQTIVIICLLTFMAMLILSYPITNSITRPIKQLAQSMQVTAKDGNLNGIDVPRATYEVNVLYRGFNDLMARIRTLIEQINQEQEEKSNYRFRLIQSQLRPHFLYNSLQTIKSLIDLGINDTASECLSAMSTLYRLSLNRGNDILSVGDELELSTKYMYIQMLRYIDRLNYVFDVPESLNGCLIPKMTLQPILENAIYHGIKEKEGKGLIEVIGRDEGDTMLFSVSDDGNGMSPQELEALRAAVDGDAQTDRQNVSFGLYSVNRRIKMLFGNEYGLSIDSRAGEYTIVTLVMPKKTAVTSRTALLEGETP